MPDKELKCPRCAAVMERGFVADTGFDTQGRHRRWVEGEPAKSFFGLFLKRRTVPSSRTYRCTGCGYLESYANTPIA